MSLRNRQLRNLSLFVFSFGFTMLMAHKLGCKAACLVAYGFGVAPCACIVSMGWLV